MNISSNTLVGEVVKHNFRTASIFRQNNIDYCCGGKKSISDACREAGVDSGEMISSLEKIFSMKDPDTDFINNLRPDELIDYIVKRHHTYVRNNMDFLIANLKKISDVHGQNHPELGNVRDAFIESAQNLTMHMQKEELMLFPYIKNLVKWKEENLIPKRPVFGSVSNPVLMMLEEHESEGKRFEYISELTNQYSIPDDACTTYEVTINLLNEFESDLHRHIHLENNILFPRAIEMEHELVEKTS